MTEKFWILDCDNTLYPQDTGFFERVNQRIISYMRHRMGFADEEIEAKRKSWREAHGMTLGGLMADHKVDPEDYLSYVHDVELEDIIFPDPALSEVMDKLKGERVVFTNGSVTHAKRVLKRLGVAGKVSGVYDIAFTDFVPKPRPHGYEKLVKTLGALPGDCVMVDDIPKNLETAKKMGMTTVLVGGEPQENHLHCPRFHDILGLID